MSNTIFTNYSRNLYGLYPGKYSQPGAPDSISKTLGTSAEGLAPEDTVSAVSHENENGLQNMEGREQKNGNFDSFECTTCKNRKYQDGSDDPGVSFKTPTRLDPQKAAVSVRAHENEHVVRERAEAQRTDRRVVSQSVTYHSAICPECGSVYTSGGTTRTVTKAQVEQTYGLSEEDNATGSYLDMAV